MVYLIIYLIGCLFSPQVDFLFEGEDMVSLLIDKCVPEDDGDYTLTAINMAGEESNTARVFVVGKENI